MGITFALLIVLVIFVTLAKGDVNFNEFAGEYSLIQGGLACCTSLVTVKSTGRNLDDIRFENGIQQCRIRSPELERTRLPADNKFRAVFGFSVRIVMPLDCGPDERVRMELYRPSETFEFSVGRLFPILQRSGVKYMHFVRHDARDWCIYQARDQSSERNRPVAEISPSSSPSSEADPGEEAEADNDQENGPEVNPDSGENDNQDNMPEENQDSAPDNNQDDEPNSVPENNQDDTPDSVPGENPGSPPDRSTDSDANADNNPDSSPTPTPTPNNNQDMETDNDTDGTPSPLPPSTSPSTTASFSTSPVSVPNSNPTIENTTAPVPVTNSSSTAAVGASQGSLFAWLGPVLGAIIVGALALLGVYCISLRGYD